MNLTQVSEGIFRLSANMHDILFEGIWPIPNGVSMNSYIVKGEKSAIIDGVCGWDGVPETLFEQLEKMQININDIDYVIINHMEPDHSGWLEEFIKLRGNSFTVYCSPKAVPLLEHFIDLPELTVVEVVEGDTLSLGGGKELLFAEIPNVHWPETIATFETSTGTLMPCDAFGSFGAITDSPYDDMLTDKEIAFFEEETVRYYSNIVSAFSHPVSKAVEKVENVIGDQLKVVAPGHGIVWRKNPQKIINDYKRLAAFQKSVDTNEVTLIWGSMYGMTEMSVPYIIEGLKEGGATVHQFRVPDSHIGDILTKVWTSSAVVLAMPTYEYKMFPPMFAVLDELGKKKVFNRQAFRVGSFGWSGGAQKELDELITKHRMNWEFLEPVEFKGKPSESTLSLIKTRSRELAEKVVAISKGAELEYTEV